MFFDNIVSFNSTVKSKKYKCPFCIKSFVNPEYLFYHVSTAHKEEIPPGKSVKQTVYDIKHPIEHLCQICKVRKCVWLEKSGHYSTLCDNPQCKEEARRRFQANYKKKYGKERQADVDEIREMIKKKPSAGMYKFQDGSSIPYNSSFEKDFLEFYDFSLEQKSSTIQECMFVYEYKYEGKVRHYLPDFYIPSLDLIIEIKANANISHPKIIAITKECEHLKDLAVKKDGNHNFIKIVDKDYEPFYKLFELLQNNYLSDKPLKEKIIVIPKYEKYTVNGFEIPKMNFLASDKTMTESFLMRKLLDSCNGILNLSQVVDKDNVANFAESDFKDSDIIMLRTYETDFKDELSVKHTFKEFKYYYTKKYQKYVSQDFISIRFDISKLKDWHCIQVKYVKVAEQKKLIKLINYKLEEFNINTYNFYNTSTGFMLLFYSTDNVSEMFNNIKTEIEKVAVNAKCILNIEQVHLPGSVDAGTPVEDIKI